MLDGLHHTLVVRDTSHNIGGVQWVPNFAQEASYRSVKGQNLEILVNFSTIFLVPFLFVVSNLAILIIPVAK